MAAHLESVLAVAGLLLVGQVLSCGRCSKPLLEDSAYCHGGVNDCKPTGQKDDGVIGSELSALADWDDLSRLRECYEKVASENCVQVSLIAAIASRESRGGRVLNATNGYSSDGQSFGILQCDLRTFNQRCLACAWDSCCHVEMMVKEVFMRYVKRVQRRYENWEQCEQLQAAVAAYNLKTPKIRFREQMDRFTTNQDYSNDVLARAQYLRRNGWINPMKLS